MAQAEAVTLERGSCMARREDFLGDVEGLGAADTNNPDASLSKRGGDGCDGVLFERHGICPEWVETH
jgi:hypothetical protein